MPVAVAALAVGHLPARLVVVGASLIAAATVRGRGWLAVVPDGMRHGWARPATDTISTVADGRRAGRSSPRICNPGRRWCGLPPHPGWGSFPRRIGGSR